MKLGGIVYLHDIIQPRMTGTACRNLTLFRKLCGDGALSKVVLGTTKWGESRDEKGPELREKELYDVFWEEMLHEGSVMRRFEGTTESAWEFVEIILDGVPRKKLGKFTDALQIQGELVDSGRRIPETEVGKELREALTKQLRELQQKESEVGMVVDDPRSVAMLREIRSKIINTLYQLRDLNITTPPSRRMMEFFGLAVSPCLMPSISFQRYH